MNDKLSEFWRATWSAWRSGVLSSLSPNFAQIAAGEYDDFVKTSADFKNPLISAFFATHPPLAGEFLIGFGESGNQPGMIMTSHRLWMFDKQNGEFVGFTLSDVTQIKSSAGWNSHNVIIRFRDNKEQRFPKMASAPSDQAVKLAIERCGAPEGWTISAPTAQSLDKDQGGTTSEGVQTQPRNPIAEALSASAFAGVGAGLAAHYFAGGKLTFPIWIAAYVLVIANVKNKLVATVVFAAVAALVTAVLGSLAPGR